MSELIKIEYQEGKEMKTDTCDNVGSLPCYITPLIRKGVTRILVKTEQLLIQSAFNKQTTKHDVLFVGR